MTMDRDRVFLPNLNIEPSAGIVLDRQGEEGHKICSVVTYNFGGESYTWKIFDSSAIIVNAMTRDVSASTHKFNTRQEIPAPVVAHATQLKVMAMPLDHKVTTIIEIYGESSGAVGYIPVTALANIRELPR